MTVALEAVDDHLALEADLLLHEERVHVRPLVARQLDDLAHLRVLRDGAVALEVLLEGLADALHVEVVGQTLHGRNTLPPVSLLHADVDLRLVSLLLVGVVEGVEGVEVLDLGFRHASLSFVAALGVVAGLRGVSGHGIVTASVQAIGRHVRDAFVSFLAAARVPASPAPRAPQRGRCSPESNPQWHRGARSVHHSISD